MKNNNICLLGACLLCAVTVFAQNVSLQPPPQQLIVQNKTIDLPAVYQLNGEKEVLDTLELMSLYCFCVDIEKPAVSPIRDVKDLYLLSLADTIPADYIISGDKDLLVLGKHNETRILDYNSFLSLL